MSITIDENLCAGCGKCGAVCPGNLIKMNERGKAYIKYPKDCWGCVSCVKECSVHAVRFYLGADIGGLGSRVHTENDGNILRWIITLPDGKITEVNVNRGESNKY